MNGNFSFWDLDVSIKAAGMFGAERSLVYALRGYEAF